MRNPVKCGLAAVVVAAGILVAGCSSGNGSNTASSSAVAPGSATGGQVAGADRSQQDSSPGADRPAVRAKAKIKTGEISLTSKHPDAARRQVDRLLVAFGGTVDSEQTSHARDGSIERSTLVLRVPVGRFGAAMDALERIGTLKTSDSQTKDVTTQVIDVRERVRTLRTSLGRLHKFQRQTANIDDLIRFEQEITDRESELQSLVAQRDALHDQTTMSTITLYLSVPARYVPPPDGLRHAGFVAGLGAGWRALVDTVVVVLTVVGALLPFAVLLGLLGAPVWLLVRRAVRARRTGAPVAAGGADGPAAP